ncbi:50S ribosomal protein L10 [Acholeplasma sp. OttesenSCG-928-E16]|nr:50S ribosomal protein L10 [Acholeplasma sp. OttesenSCG-928-E16]
MQTKPSIQKKIDAVNDLATKFKEAKTIVSFDYPGLTVASFMELRNKLREAGCEVKVYKNNISQRAAVVAGYDDLADTLVGAKAIASSATDVVAPAKVVYDFSKAHKEVKIGAGVIEGVVADVNAIMALATLPSREGLLTQLAVGLLSPIRELAIGLNMLTEK